MERRAFLSEKQRDNQNRILRSGESQRQDRRYAFKYKGINGETKFVFIWKLNKNDRAPVGRTQEEAPLPGCRSGHSSSSFRRIPAATNTMTESTSLFRAADFCFCGLTILDIGFRKRRIRADH